MGNCMGSAAAAQVASQPSTALPSPATGPSLKAPSSGGSACGRSAGGRESAEEAYPDGRILEVPNLRIFTFLELRAATQKFKADYVLGEGGFGRVYKGWVDEKTLNPSKSGVGMIVAVKKLNPESMQGLQEWQVAVGMSEVLFFFANWLLKLQSEVNFLGRLSHLNLVKLLGYCWEDKELLLVYEFMSRGSLENHLFRRGAGFRPLSWSLRLKIAIGAARGLAFLHTSEKQVIYRDFKASNILLDSNFNAKLSDFGLAKNGPTGNDTHVTTRVMGTYGYAAPEYVATGHLYIKSDVYGFGVVLLEMLTGLRALDANRPSGQHNLVDWAKPVLADRHKLARLMDLRLEGQYPSKGALQAAQLTLKCLASDPKSRPSMKEVVAALEDIESMKSRPAELRDLSPRRGARSRGSAHAHHHSPYTPRHDDSRSAGRVSHPSPGLR